jgi:hypothetical protein
MTLVMPIDYAYTQKSKTKHTNQHEFSQLRHITGSWVDSAIGRKLPSVDEAGYKDDALTLPRAGKGSLIYQADFLMPYGFTNSQIQCNISVPYDVNPFLGTLMPCLPAPAAPPLTRSPPDTPIECKPSGETKSDSSTWPHNDALRAKQQFIFACTIHCMTLLVVIVHLLFASIATECKHPVSVFFDPAAGHPSETERDGIGSGVVGTGVEYVSVQGSVLLPSTYKEGREKTEKGVIPPLREKIRKRIVAKKDGKTTE